MAKPYQADAAPRVNVVSTPKRGDMARYLAVISVNGVRDVATGFSDTPLGALAAAESVAPTTPNSRVIEVWFGVDDSFIQQKTAEVRGS